MKIDKNNKKKRKIHFKPVDKIIKPIIDESTTIECCICNESTFVFNTECNHYMCLRCITNLEQKVCPICRTSLDNLPEKIKMIMPAYQTQYNIIHDDSDDELIPPYGQAVIDLTQNEDVARETIPTTTIENDTNIGDSMFVQAPPPPTYHPTVESQSESESESDDE